MNRAEQVIEHKVNDFLAHFHKEHTMTTPAQSPNAQGPDTSPATFIAMLHHNLALFTDSVAHFLPKLEAIAVNPVLDDGVEALLAAFAGPMAEEVFAAVVTLLKADPADHLDAAIGLLSTVAHQAPAVDPILASLQASAPQGLRQAVAAGGGDVQARLAAPAPASPTGPQPVIAPRVI